MILTEREVRKMSKKVRIALYITSIVFTAVVLVLLIFNKQVEKQTGSTDAVTEYAESTNTESTNTEKLSTESINTEGTDTENVSTESMNTEKINTKLMKLKKL